MFTGTDGLEPNEGYLHAQQCADSIPRRVGYIKTVCVTAHQCEGESVQRDHVRDECVATCEAYVSRGPLYQIREIYPMLQPCRNRKRLRLCYTAHWLAS
jgi:hypothetical protein